MKCCDITAGMLDKLITLQANTKSPNGSGGFTYLWAPYATGVRAGVKNLSGYERMQAERIDAAVRKRFTIRYRNDIKEADQIIFDGRVHNITFIDNVEYKNRWMIIDADAGVPVKGDG